MKRYHVHCSEFIKLSIRRALNQSTHLRLLIKTRLVEALLMHTLNAFNVFDFI